MSEEFKVLDDRDHILLRTQMYAGSTTCEPNAGIINFEYQERIIVPALIKMVEEIFQNSIEEFVKTDGKFSTEISLDINDTLYGTEITVSDNGRGIPQNLINGVPRPVIAWTVLRAGTNFDDSVRKGASANGLGSVLTNILSTSFIGATCDGTDMITVTCSDNMSKISHKKTKSNKRGTTVKFIPDISRFGILDFSEDHRVVLKDRIYNLAILYPQIQFSFCGEKIQFKNIKHIAKKFHEDAISYEKGNISMVFAPSGKDEEFRVLSYVNGLYIKNGGSHVDFIVNKVIENLRGHIKKKHKIDVMPNQIRQHLLFASWISGFPALKVDSQAKERVTNPTSEVATVLGDLDLDKLSKQLLDTPSIIDPMVAAILYKQELKELKELESKKKESRAARVANHIAATDENPENKTLFLAEGLSALANFIATRDSRTMGAFPLKGKPLNVQGRRPLEIMKNDELANIIRIVGLELGSPAKNLKYGKIAVFSDRDLDGHAIYCLLLNFFALWPELFHEKRIYRVMTPLFYCTKGKQVKIFYSLAEYMAENLDGWKVDRYKGLGSMPEDVYSECINNPVMERISDFDIKKLNMAFGDDASLRKKWMME